MGFGAFKIPFVLLIGASVLLSRAEPAHAILPEQARFHGAARVGIFIGTFSPPHQGHDQAMHNAIEAAALDYVIIVPNDLALHKLDAAKHEFRHKLVLLKYQNDPKILIPNPELITSPLIVHVLGYLSEFEENHGIKIEKFGVMGGDVATSSLRRFIWELLPGWREWRSSRPRPKSTRDFVRRSPTLIPTFLMRSLNPASIAPKALIPRSMAIRTSARRGVI